MIDKIRYSDFKNKPELSDENIKREVGKLRVEKDTEAGEKETVELKPHEVPEFIKKEAVDRSGKTVTSLEKDLIKKHKIVKEQKKKRDNIVKLFKKDKEKKKKQPPPPPPEIDPEQFFDKAA